MVLNRTHKLPPFEGLTPSQPDLACCRGSDPGGVVGAASADGVGRPGGEKSALVSPNEQQEIRETKHALAISLHIVPHLIEKI